MQKEILQKFGSKIVLPVDVGLNIEGKRVDSDVESISSGRIFDIGPNTIYDYVRRIMNAKYVVLNGPMGVYENPDFSTGTFRIEDAVSRIQVLGSRYPEDLQKQVGR